MKTTEKIVHLICVFFITVFIFFSGFGVGFSKRVMDEEHGYDISNCPIGTNIVECGKPRGSGGPGLPICEISIYQLINGECVKYKVYRSIVLPFDLGVIGEPINGMGPF